MTEEITMLFQTADRKKVRVNRNWDPMAGDIGALPLTFRRVLWSHKNDLIQQIGALLANGVYIYIEYDIEDKEFLIVPVSDRAGLEFFIPDEIRKTKRPDPHPELLRHAFDLADEF